MREIAALLPNGYTAVSTFSGCGGSSLGYKLAGYRVAWANEFVPAARETYLANFPTTIVDARDIRTIDPAEILAAIGRGVGDLDLFDGSPPCASFSMSGKREAAWGKVKAYSDTKQRVDDLFFEYARLLRGLQPKVFVAENVSGLVKGTAKGYFLEILASLRACGYEVAAKLLNAEWLGVPQVRQRLIFVGVRADLVERYGVAPIHPKPLPYRYTLRDAFADLDAPIEPEASITRFAIGREWANVLPGTTSDKYINLARASFGKPSPTVTQTAGISGAAGVTHPSEPRKYSIAELKRVCAFPDDFALTGTYRQQWERLGRAVPPVMMSYIGSTIAREILDRCK